MSRSLKKGVYIHPKLKKKVENLKPGSRSVIRTWSRASMILPEMVGMTFEVHNGKVFLGVSVNENMVGHRLGEFSPTRKFFRHGGKMQKDIEQKSKGEAPSVAAPQAPKAGAKK